MPHTALECHASKMVNGDTRPRPTTQVALAILCLGSLLIKRQLEKPRRDFGIWALDTGKQVVSQICAHFAGLLNSYYLASKTIGGDECSWYFIAFSLDTVRYAPHNHHVGAAATAVCIGNDRPPTA